MFLYTILFLSIIISHFNVLAAQCSRNAPYVQSTSGTAECECGSETCTQKHDAFDATAYENAGSGALYYQPWCNEGRCGDSIPECPDTTGQTKFDLGVNTVFANGITGSISKESPGTHCTCGDATCMEWWSTPGDYDGVIRHKYCDAEMSKCSMTLPFCTNTNGTVEQSTYCACATKDSTFFPIENVAFCVHPYKNYGYRSTNKYCDTSGNEPICHADQQIWCTDGVPIAGESCKCGSGLCEIGGTCSNSACVYPICTNTAGQNPNSVLCMCNTEKCTLSNRYCDTGTCRDAPRCTNTIGQNPNSVSCMCNTTKCTLSNRYCNANQCSPYKLCQENIITGESCMCGDSNTCSEGQKCSNGTCVNPDCTNVDGYDKNNVARCECGSSTCDTSSGLYCNASANSCRTVGICRRDQNNDEECECVSVRSNDTCTASTGLLCQSSGPSKCDDNSGRDETDCTKADDWKERKCCTTFKYGVNQENCYNVVSEDGQDCCDPNTNPTCFCPSFLCCSSTSGIVEGVVNCPINDSPGNNAGWIEARCNDERPPYSQFNAFEPGRTEAECNNTAAKWVEDLCEPDICENRDGLIVNDVHCKCDAEKVTNGDYDSASTFCGPNEYCKEADITWDGWDSQWAQRGRDAKCNSTKFCEHTDGMTAASANCKCGNTACVSGQYCFDLFDPRDGGSTANLDSSACLDKPLCGNTDGTVLNDGDCVCGDKTCNKTNGHICSSFDKDYYIFTETGRAQRKIVVQGECRHPECPNDDGQSCKCGSNTCDVDNGMKCGLEKVYRKVNSDTCSNDVGTLYDCIEALKTPFQPYCLDKSNRNEIQCVLNASTWLDMCVDSSGRNQIQCALNASTWEAGTSFYEQSVDQNIYLVQGQQLNQFPPGCSVLSKPFLAAGNAQHSMYFNPNMSSSIQCGQGNRDCICSNTQGGATCSIEYCANTDGETPNNVKCHCGPRQCKVGQYCSTVNYTCSDVPECEWQDGSQVTNTACKCNSANCAVGQLCTAGICETPASCSETDGNLPNNGICSCGATTAGSCVRWRQTDSAGEREFYNDKSCDVVIVSGSDGYCECDNRHEKFAQCTNGVLNASGTGCLHPVLSGSSCTNGGVVNAAGTGCKHPVLTGSNCTYGVLNDAETGCLQTVFNSSCTNGVLNAAKTGCLQPFLTGLSCTNGVVTVGISGTGCLPTVLADVSCTNGGVVNASGTGCLQTVFTNGSTYDTCEDACAGTTSVICDYEHGLFCNAATFTCSTQSSERYLQNINTCNSFRTTYGNSEKCTTPTPALKSCQNCPVGKYITDYGNCEPCQGGKYSAANATGCLSCDAGKFSQPGSLSCSPCDAGKFSQPGSSSCSPCPEGKKNSSLPGNETTACDACEVGKFQPSTGQVSCQDCPVGQYQNSGSQSVCKSCPIGKYQDSSGETICKSCSVGKYNNKEGQNNSVACVQCTPGYYTNDTATVECQTCPDGYYQSEHGKSDCDACLVGKYGHSEGTEPACQNCPVGYYSDVNASKVCYICPAGSITGTYGTGGTFCEECPTNKNSYQSNSTECFKAPRVTFDGTEVETCSPDVTMVWQNQADDIWEVSKENYIACNTTGGTHRAPLELRDGSKPLPLGAIAGKTRYFISTRNCTDDGKFLTSCTNKTFGIVNAYNTSGQCQKQCARWRGAIKSGFQDGDIDIELRGANCNAMQANVKPVSSDMCQLFLIQAKWQVVKKLYHMNGHNCGVDDTPKACPNKNLNLETWTCTQDNSNIDQKIVDASTLTFEKLKHLYNAHQCGLKGTVCANQYLNVTSWECVATN